MTRIAAFYCFVAIADPHAERNTIEVLCAAAGIRGTIILACEGFNGTVGGPAEAIALLISRLKALASGGCPEIKYADAAAIPFARLKVRVKPEIVTMGIPDLDVVTMRGDLVPPTAWNALIADPATILIDTRNAYEVAIGSFAGAIDPGTERFTAFPAWLAQLAAGMSAAERRDRPVAMFCTGGIRCEKSTALARNLGLERVHHLEGGILAYLEQVTAEDSLWSGDCFVFDERVAVGHGLAPGDHRMCAACGRPVPKNGDAQTHSCTTEQDGR